MTKMTKLILSTALSIYAPPPPTPDKGEFVISVIGFIGSYRRTLEFTEIEKRLQALENAY